MSRMVGMEGKVVGIDYLSPLVELAVENVMKADADLLDSALIQKGFAVELIGGPRAATCNCVTQMMWQHVLGNPSLCQSRAP